MGSANVYDKMNPLFLNRLNALRGRLDHPMIITSSYRSKEYNKAIGGSKNSKHMQGIAVDVKCTDGDFRMRLVREAIDMGFTVGVGKNFVHLDTRLNQIVFGYG